MSTSIVWFRKDLRLRDNQALLSAIHRNVPMILLYLYDEENFQGASASKRWLHASLESLAQDITNLGSTLFIKKGSEKELIELIKKYKVDTVFWNRDYEPGSLQKESALLKELSKIGCRGEVFSGNFMFPPGSIFTPKGTPYKVFTPYLNAVLKEAAPRRSFALPQNLPKCPFAISSDLLEEVDFSSRYGDTWSPGEKGALLALKEFSSKVDKYPVLRDFPAETGTSKLSAHLHFGEISPFTVWHALAHKDSQPYLRQLIWREFAATLLHFFPETKTEPLRPEFKNFSWSTNQEFLKKWQEGNTGYPIVDAGMRELKETGWMHNRVRMIVASFLVKDLGLDWKAGESWFFDRLVDADLPNNIFGWQWAAGCGADAAPYFRIFNPTSQGEKFDPLGNYVRKYVPELADLPAKWIHRPIEAPREILKAAGVTLGLNYPFPIVDHKIAREEALARYAKVKSSYE